jgi:hypothetical protein
MKSPERRRDQRPQDVTSWNADVRKMFQSVEAMVLQEVAAPMRCPRCQAAAESLGDYPTMMDWYCCGACENLWAARSARAV